MGEEEGQGGMVDLPDHSVFAINMNSVSVRIQATINTQQALDDVVAALTANRALLPVSVGRICASCGTKAVKVGDDVWEYDCDCGIYTPPQTSDRGDDE